MIARGLSSRSAAARRVRPLPCLVAHAAPSCRGTLTASGCRSCSSAAGQRRRRPQTPHEVLGVSPSASDEDIKVAYRRLALQRHPDVLGQGASPERRQAAEEEFKELEAAYSELLGRGTEDAGHSWEGGQGPESQRTWWTGRRLFQLIAAVGVPVGVFTHDFFVGTWGQMRAEDARLRAGGWACPECTFVNEAGTLLCEHCQSPRPSEEPEDLVFVPRVDEKLGAGDADPPISSAASGALEPCVLLPCAGQGVEMSGAVLPIAADSGAFEPSSAAGPP